MLSTPATVLPSSLFCRCSATLGLVCAVGREEQPSARLFAFSPSHSFTFFCRKNSRTMAPSTRSRTKVDPVDVLSRLFEEWQVRVREAELDKSDVCLESINPRHPQPFSGRNITEKAHLFLRELRHPPQPFLLKDIIETHLESLKKALKDYQFSVNKPLEKVEEATVSNNKSKLVQKQTSAIPASPTQETSTPTTPTRATPALVILAHNVSTHNVSTTQPGSSSSAATVSNDRTESVHNQTPATPATLTTATPTSAPPVPKDLTTQPESSSADQRAPPGAPLPGHTQKMDNEMTDPLSKGKALLDWIDAAQNSHGFVDASGKSYDESLGIFTHFWTSLTTSYPRQLQIDSTNAPTFLLPPILGFPRTVTSSETMPGEGAVRSTDSNTPKTPVGKFAYTPKKITLGLESPLGLKGLHNVSLYKFRAAFRVLNSSASRE